MSRPLDVLLLEDSASDAERLVLELRRAGFDPTWERVADRASYVTALDHGPDIVLADSSLPQLMALDALDLLRGSGHDIPVIVVSGAMSEESCVDALRHGAADYLLKDRLSRLGPAVEHALEQRRMVRERSLAQLASVRHQQRFRAAFDNAPLGMAVTTHDGVVVDANPALKAMVAGSAVTMRGRRLTELVAEVDHAVVDRAMRALMQGGSAATGHEVRLRGPGGAVTWAHYSSSLVSDPDADTGRVVHQFLDTTARRRAEDELVRQAEVLTRSNAELQKLDWLKSTFLATVSHELRTPLSNICGYTELLAEASADELGPTQRRMVQVVDRNAERLQRLIEDLLSFARLEAGTLAPERAPMDLNDVVIRALEEVGPTAAAAGVTLEATLEPGALTISADRVQIGRVLTGLLSNAVKFHAPGGSATVATQVRTTTVAVWVTDDGPGIAAGEHSQLFQRFYRGNDARSREIAGTGLGLSIARAVVEAHGGTIELESEPGAGTTVTFQLPR